MKKTILILAILLGLISCKKQPLVQPSGGSNSTSTTQNSNVIITYKLILTGPNATTFQINRTGAIYPFTSILNDMVSGNTQYSYTFDASKAYPTNQPYQWSFNWSLDQQIAVPVADQSGSNGPDFIEAQIIINGVVKQDTTINIHNGTYDGSLVLYY